MEEMVRAAIDKGFEAIGFSSHSHVPFDPSYCLRDEAGYVQELERLQQQYGETIRIYKGIELDYYSETDLTPYEYVIGSVHYVKHNETYYTFDNGTELFEQALREAFAGSVYDMVRAYYALVVTMIQTYEPTIIGHFDLITKYNDSHHYFDENSEAYRTIIDEALAQLAGQSLLFEMNVSPLYRRMKRYAYPHPYILQKLYDMGHRIIITNDAHDTGSLGYGFAEALQLLKDIGFTSVSAYTRNGLETVAI